MYSKDQRSRINNYDRMRADQERMANLANKARDLKAKIKARNRNSIAGGMTTDVLNSSAKKMLSPVRSRSPSRSSMSPSRRGNKRSFMDPNDFRYDVIIFLNLKTDRV